MTVLVNPIYDHNNRTKLVGVFLHCETEQDKADLLKGCTQGMSAWSERPTWTHRLLDVLRAEEKRVCPACGKPHYGPWQHCADCKRAIDGGERP